MAADLEPEGDVEGRAGYLHGAARILFSSGLDKLLEDTARELDQADPAPRACPNCSQVWLPGVTCKLRLVALKGKSRNKKSRQKKIDKLKKYLETVATRKQNFVPEKRQFLQYTCSRCRFVHHNKVDIPELGASKASDHKDGSKLSKGAAAKARAKKRKEKFSVQTSQAAALPKPGGLSLSDFLL